MDNRNDTKISGSGSINGGIYHNVHVSGSAKLKGDIDCYELHCSGSAHAYGAVHCATQIHCSGSFTCDGNMDAGERIHISGSSNVKGTLRGPNIHISGSLNAHKSVYGEKIKISGGATVKENVEGETIEIRGGCQIDGNLNGEDIELVLSDTTMRIASIGGAQITVKNTEHTTNILSRLFGPNRNGRLVAELIEGDTIELTDTECKTVRGKHVTIMGNSKIDRVEYSESLFAEPATTVLECEKI